MPLLPFFIGAIPSALAADGTPPNIPAVLCDTGLVPGCGDPIANVALNSVIPDVATLLLNVSVALALIFVLIGGARYLLSFGREEEHTKAFKSILWALVGLLTVLMAHQIVAIVASETYVSGGHPLFSFFQQIVRVLISLLNVAFFIVIVYGGFRMVQARGRDEEVSKGRKAIIYAILGAMIINITPVMVKSLLQILIP